MANSSKIFEPQISPDQSIVRPIIDNMTFVLHDISIKGVFEHFELMDYYDDFMFKHDLYEMSRGFVDDVMLDFLHIHFYIRRFFVSDTWDLDGFNLSNITDKKIPKIRIEFTGTALRYLRSTCEWDELYFLTKPFLSEKDHLTRVDIAYDLVNYRPDFLKRCIAYTDNPDNLSPAGRLCVLGLKGNGLSWETRGGATKTLYLGSPQSDKRLRIYDKKVERGDKICESDFPECSSWIRIEWQCRNAIANGFHVQDVSDSKAFYLRIFRKIYDDFHFCYYDKKQRRQVPAPFWSDLWNWEEIESIILNAKYSRAVDTYVAACAMMERSLRDILLVLAIFDLTPDDLLEMLNERLREINHPKNSTEEKRRQRFKAKYRAFSSCLPDFQHTHFDGNNFWLNPINHVHAQQETIQFETAQPQFANIITMEVHQHG